MLMKLRTALVVVSLFLSLAISADHKSNECAGCWIAPVSASMVEQSLGVNIRALFILDYGNPLYTEGKSVRTPAARDAFVKWAVAAAKHFAGRGVVWELFNEPNIAIFWPPQPNVDEYKALADEIGHAFHASVPNEQLIGPATSTIDFRFLESCFKSKLLDHWS